MSHPILEQFLDDQKPVANLNHVSLSINLNSIGLDISSYKTLLKYEKIGNNCYITNAKFDGITLQNQDFRKIFLEDLKLVLKNQRAPITSFMVYINIFELDGPQNQDKLAEEFLEMMRASLGSYGFKIPVKRLTLGTVSQNEIITIVPYLDPNCLELIEMSMSRNVNSISIDLDQFVKTEQFKNLKTLLMSQLIVNVPFEKFSHLTRVSIYWTSFTGGNLAQLKQLFLQHPNMNSFAINTKHINKDDYNKVLGPSKQDKTQWGAPYEKWFCQVPGSDKALQFSLSGDSDNWCFGIGRTAAKNAGF